MGVFSKFHRFHEAGEAANVNNVERFGEPDHSLFTSSKVFSLHHHIDITDDQERHFITMASGEKFEMSNELLHLIKDITNIEGLGWQLRGNIAGLNFELYDRDESIIAVIGQKAISLHDKFCIDIYRPEYEKTVVAILVTLIHMMKDRESSVSFSSSSSGSSGNG